MIQKIPSAILDKASIIHLPKGQSLFLQGDECTYVYYICSGKIQVYDETANGEIMRVVWVLPGQTVGEMEILAGTRCSIYSAKVFDDKTSVIRIPKNDYLSWIMSDNVFCAEVARSVAKKLLVTARTLQQQTAHDSIQVVKECLLDQAHELFLEGASYVSIEQTRTEIAANCRISERTVNRCIKVLKECELLSVHRGKINISQAQYQKLLEEDGK